MERQRYVASLVFKLGCNEIAAASAVSSGKLLHTGQIGSGRKECRVHCSVCKFSKMSSFSKEG
ncbi:hypothetical protein BASH2_04587 [Bacillus anthracis]|nr:hypothetical protein BASH2_04587 [Bacillus anthracis]